MLGRLRRARERLEALEASYTSVPPRAEPSLARDVVVASLDPERGRISGFGDLAAAGALLVELTREGRLAVSGSGRSTRVTVRDSAPLGNAELDEALLLVVGGMFGTKAARLVSVLDDGQLVRRLVAAGEILEDSHRSWGMFTERRRFPTPAARRDELVAQVQSVLRGTTVPDERTAVLISLLDVMDLSRWVPKQQVKEADRRAQEILERLGEDERALVSAVRVAIDRSTS